MSGTLTILYIFLHFQSSLYLYLALPLCLYKYLYSKTSIEMCQMQKTFPFWSTATLKSEKSIFILRKIKLLFFG